MEKLPYQELIEGPLPHWVKRFIKSVGRTINTYSMIKEGDVVLLSASGGKDSLALALALALRKRWLPIDYTLKAVMINWIEHPIPPEFRSRLTEFFSALGYEFTIVDEQQHCTSFDGEFNCYLCSRNRRRILFQWCAEHSIELIAMGHHLDDLVETSIMNLFFRGSFTTMQPVQPFFDGEIRVIRPMIEVHESILLRLQESYDLPVIKPVCPFDQTNIRSRIKPIVADLASIDPLSREHLFKAHHLKRDV